MSNQEIFGKLIAKIKISGKICLLTGMHIGHSGDMGAIGAVDLVVIKDRKGRPVIPGSTLKGKTRTLLARTLLKDGEFLKEHKADDEKVLRLYGGMTDDHFYESRLQFMDCEMSNEEEIRKNELELGITEIKFENTINRLTGEANPRQIERVPAGSEFNFNLIYNLVDENEADDDIESIITALTLLQLDFIGGHGSRGYGRIEIKDLNIETLWGEHDSLKDTFSMFKDEMRSLVDERSMVTA